MSLRCGIPRGQPPAPRSGRLEELRPVPALAGTWVAFPRREPCGQPGGLAACRGGARPGAEKLASARFLPAAVPGGSKLGPQRGPSDRTFTIHPPWSACPAGLRRGARVGGVGPANSRACGGGCGRAPFTEGTVGRRTVRDGASGLSGGARRIAQGRRWREGSAVLEGPSSLARLLAPFATALPRGPEVGTGRRNESRECPLSPRPRA